MGNFLLWLRKRIKPGQNQSLGSKRTSVKSVCFSKNDHPNVPSADVKKPSLLLEGKGESSDEISA